MQWQEFRSHIRHLPAKDAARIERAFVLGKTVHAGQKRKSGEPYFSHPVAVGHMLADMGADADTLIAALLHDSVEDTPLTLAEIDKLFDGSVATLIDGVTKLGAGDLKSSPKLNEQMESLRKIFTLMQQDVRIMVIKLVDRLHNMQTVEFLSPARQEGLARETLDVYVKIADRLCMQDLRDELEALCLAILEPEQYRKLSDLRAANEQRGLSAIEQMRSRIRGQDTILASRVQMHFEPKTWEQLTSQLLSGDAVATGRSMITVAFVCEDIDSCYRTLGTLHQLWKREVLSFQDFINAPQINGYQGLHTTVIAQDGTRVRCKIRTRDMQEYARKGIAMNCFDSQALGIAEYLPWTQRISPLTSDTEGSSNDFWESLRSDILGESIIIHGPGDATVQLPHDATVLDGAFYLLQDRALRAASIRMNGVDVPFGTKLTNAATLDVSLSDRTECSRDWLLMVHTGLAAAAIRSELAKLSESQKLETGREMLQRTFTERKRGFIEEYDEHGFETQLQTLGYRSLHDAYISIADGRVEPQEVYAALFEQQEKKSARTPQSLVRYTVNMDAIDVMDRINLTHRRYGPSLSDIRYHRTEGNEAAVTLRVRMRPSDLATFQQELAIAGAEHVSAIRQSIAVMGLISVIVFLWGMDPVIARSLLLTEYISATDLTVIRFFTFFAASSVTYGLHLLFSRIKAKPISPLKPSFVASAAALFLTAILSYIALTSISASQYILFIIAGLVLTGMIERVLEHRVDLRSLLACGFMTAAIGTAVALQSHTVLGLLAASGSALGFAMYSQLSRRYQETEARIHARYPAFVFWLSLLTLLLTITLVPAMRPLTDIGLPTMFLAVAFAFVFTFLPYALFFECMRKSDTEVLDRLLPFVSIITILGELVIGRMASGLVLLPLLAIFLWLYKPDWIGGRAE